MSWATEHIAALKVGTTVRFRPHGGSMRGKIESGQLVTIEPITNQAQLVVGAIVLCSVGGAQYLHLIKAVKDGQYQIGNNLGRINGWVKLGSIFGICTGVES